MTYVKLSGSCSVVLSLLSTILTSNSRLVFAFCLICFIWKNEPKWKTVIQYRVKCMHFSRLTCSSIPSERTHHWLDWLNFDLSCSNELIIFFDVCWFNSLFDCSISRKLFIKSINSFGWRYTFMPFSLSQTRKSKKFFFTRIFFLQLLHILTAYYRNHAPFHVHILASTKCRHRFVSVWNYICQILNHPVPGTINWFIQRGNALGNTVRAGIVGFFCWTIFPVRSNRFRILKRKPNLIS